jgi:hypothetical protein
MFVIATHDLEGIALELLQKQEPPWTYNDIN